MHGETIARFARTLFPAAVALLIAGAAFAQDQPRTDPWEPGTQWLTLRAGYAKSGVEGSGSGGAGFGFAYSRMLTGLKIWNVNLFQHYAIGAGVQHEVEGRFGPAAEITVPLTLEVRRHYVWPTLLHPYVGAGAGGYYRKTYRTGDDIRLVQLGWFVAIGGDMEVTNHNLVGVDLRMNRFRSRYDPPNPVFGDGSVKESNGVLTAKTGTLWSAMLSWTLAY